MSFMISLAEVSKSKSSTAEQLERRINDLADEIETAQMGGNHGYAEELYAESEKLQEQLDNL